MTKYLNERHADVFGRCYGLGTIGVRYFNVFGARQDPEGAYAAVIPRWVAAMLGGRPCVINGDVAVGQRTTLLELPDMLAGVLRERRPALAVAAPIFADFRHGDVRHSLADIGRARTLLG